MLQKNVEKSNQTAIKDTGWKLVIPFFAVLGILTVVSFLIPLRPTQSQMEKRNLAQFPAFSWEALVSGSYFDDITLWFSDTFPGREGWLSLSTQLNTLHGYSDINISGQLKDTEQIPPQEEPAALPAEETRERETVAAAETAPSTEVTHETEPDQWGGVDAGNLAEDDVIGDVAVIQIGDTAFNALGFSQMCSDWYARTLTDFSEEMAQLGVRVVSAPAPTSVGILIEPEYLEMLQCADQNEMIQYIHSQMGDQVIKVDTYDALVSHNDEYIYFRTDHHWTARGAYYAYEAICQALGYEAVPLEELEEWNQGEFKGSLYYKAYRPRKLKVDELIAYIPKGDIEMRVRSFYYEGTVRPVIQDMSQREVNTKYNAFLFSDNAMVELTNRDLPDGPSCVVIKDSFGNCLVPFLVQNYYKVYALDYRKFHEADLKKFLEKFPADDVIFCPYLIAIQSQDGNKMIENRCG